MDQLSSCYFCGGALDVSLSEYPVVPSELRAEAEDSKTVVLCPTCRKKLATVVEEVVSATESDADTDRAESGFEPADTTMGSDSESGFEPTDTTTESDNGSGFEPAGATTKSDNESGFEPADTAATEESDAPADGLAADSDDTESSADSGGLLGGDGPSSDQRAATDESSSAAQSSTSETTADGTDDGPTLTKLEYNKVMRLLKNRQFPVDRAEIREVATSAYQISPEEFDAVIDAAIERDLIAERNGQFVSPE